MKNLIGQKNNDSAKQPSSVNGMMYGCSVGESSQEVHTRICSEGTSYYFEQFHTSNQEACSLICKQLGI